MPRWGTLISAWRLCNTVKYSGFISEHGDLIIPDIITRLPIRTVTLWLKFVFASDVGGEPVCYCREILNVMHVPTKVYSQISYRVHSQNCQNLNFFTYTCSILNSPVPEGNKSETFSYKMRAIVYIKCHQMYIIHMSMYNTSLEPFLIKWEQLFT